MLSVEKLVKQDTAQPQDFSAKYIRHLAATNEDALYTAEDKALLTLEKDKTAAINAGIAFLNHEFKTEALAESFITKHYLDIKARQEIQVRVRKGHFTDAKRKPLWGEYIYGLLPDNRLYVLPVTSGKHHSHILAGLPAKAVGHAHFINGKLITLSNNSGHYKPTAKQMKSGIEWFYNQSEKDFVFEDHQRFSPLLVNKGLRYRKASEIVAAGNDTELTHEMSMEMLSDLIEGVVDGNFEKPMQSETIQTENELSPYAIMAVAAEDSSSDSESDYDSSSESESEECQFPPYSPEANNHGKVDAVITMGAPIRTLESMRANLMFTNAFKGTRFTGTKNLECFKAKLVKENSDVVDKENKGLKSIHKI